MSGLRPTENADHHQPGEGQRRNNDQRQHGADRLVSPAQPWSRIGAGRAPRLVRADSMHDGMGNGDACNDPERCCPRPVRRKAANSTPGHHQDRECGDVGGDHNPAGVLFHGSIAFSRGREVRSMTSWAYSIGEEPSLHGLVRSVPIVNARIDRSPYPILIAGGGDPDRHEETQHAGDQQRQQYTSCRPIAHYKHQRPADTFVLGKRGGNRFTHPERDIKCCAANSVVNLCFDHRSEEIGLSTRLSLAVHLLPGPVQFQELGHRLSRQWRLGGRTPACRRVCHRRLLGCPQPTTEPGTLQARLAGNSVYTRGVYTCIHMAAH